jgi:signal transduction histidine kinase
VARQDPAGCGPDPGVELTQLRNAIPHYLVELAKVLAKGDDPLDHRAEAAWSKVAREHGITRVRIGFDISQLVHEFIVLRQVIQEVMSVHVPDWHDQGAVLAELIEPAIAVAVQAYVDARDYEARRTQAANIGFLTHELHQPLAAAQLATSQLRRHVGKTAAHAFEILERSFRRMGELIDSVLLTEKLEAGAAVVQPVDTLLGDVMEPVEALRAAAQQKGLVFRATYDPRGVVRLDPRLTRSVVQNLVENAIKYTDAGEVEVQVTDSPDGLSIDVRDTCGGLSPEELKTIFEPFKRGRTDKTGTGLGLAIVRRAVEAQGGTISAESPGPAGCRFSVWLPRDPGRPK